MIVIVLDNPDPNDTERKGVDIEVRMMIRGATKEEAERIGTGIRKMALAIRPEVNLRKIAFRIEVDRNDDQIPRS